MKEIIKYIPSKYKIGFKVLLVWGVYYLLDLIFNFSEAQARWIVLSGFIFLIIVLPVVLWMTKVYKEETIKESKKTDKAIL